ncbi:hypothetical protein PoB_004046500 [Plakobranchus ocellatus]|uniref:OTU domain-containing protein n=1 Tax=Plakobranchus ocellatus TaxID=259542 RepID=A0AAV4B030_9GAST|nr:hypothetical protein PoB_004046500 [Plakobranchus ocellatus]
MAWSLRDSEAVAEWTCVLGNNGILLKNMASVSNLKQHLKRKCSLLSTTTSALPASTLTTSNYSSPTTQRACSSSKSPDNNITVAAGETLPPEVSFIPKGTTWRKLQCTQFGLPDRQSTEYPGPPATSLNLDDGSCFFRAVSLEITGSQQYQ